MNKVRARAHAKQLTSVTVQDIWKERRLELALEGDRWYDYVRRSYYDVDACIADLLSQRRGYWKNGLDEVYKNFVLDSEGNYGGPGTNTWDVSALVYAGDNDLVDVKPSMFIVPMPTEDVVANPNMASTAPAIHVDIRETYSYDF